MFLDYLIIVSSIPSQNSNCKLMSVIICNYFFEIGSRILLLDNPKPWWSWIWPFDFDMSTFVLMALKIQPIR